MEKICTLLEDEIASIEWNTDDEATELQNEIALFETKHGLGSKEKISALTERAEGLFRVCNDISTSMKEAKLEVKETSEDESASIGDTSSEFSVISKMS